MAAKRISKIVLHKCKLYVTSALYENAGDTSVITVRNAEDTLVNTDTYTRKHVFIKGSFRVSFPGTSQPDEIINTGDVHPVTSYEVVDSKVDLVALEDNSQLYCVIPGYSSDTMDWTTTQLAPGEAYTIRQGSMGFVFGTNYTINGNVANDNEAVACENNNADILAVDACKVIEFRVVGV